MPKNRFFSEEIRDSYRELEMNGIFNTKTSVPEGGNYS
jgi:hypothetical protein